MEDSLSDHYLQTAAVKTSVVKSKKLQINLMKANLMLMRQSKAAIKDLIWLVGSNVLGVESVVTPNRATSPSRNCPVFTQRSMMMSAIL